MLKGICIFMLYYYICSVACTIGLWKKFHDIQNKEKLEEDLNKLCNEVKGDFTREDALVAYYLIGIFFSFIVVPVIILNKLIGKKNVR